VAASAAETSSTASHSALSTSTSLSSTTSSDGSAGVAGVLLGPIQSQGDWTSPAFLITAPGWKIGWAFQCAPSATEGPTFQVYLFPANNPHATAPVIHETARSGQEVTAQSTLGQQILQVQAPASCVWAIKVTAP
jgi:hypothetical protein